MLCVLNNKAVNYIEVEEYSLADTKLTQAMKLGSTFPGRSNNEGVSPTSCLLSSVTEQPSKSTTPATKHAAESIMSRDIDARTSFHGLEACMEYVMMSGPSPDPIRLIKSMTTQTLVQATILYNRGCLLYKLNRYGLSRASFARAFSDMNLNVKDKPCDWSDDHFRLWLSIICASVLYLGQWPLHFFDTIDLAGIYDICRRKFTNESILVALASMVCAIAYARKGSLEVALMHLQRSQAIFKSFHKRARIMLAYCYVSIGQVLSKMNQHAETLKSYHLALSILQQQVSYAAYTKLLVAIGDTQFQLGYLDQALAKYEESKEILARTSDSNQELLIELNKAIGRVHQQEDDHFSAIRALKQAYEVSKKIHNTELAQDAELQVMIGTSLYELRDYTGSLQAFHKAVVIEEKSSQPSQSASMPIALSYIARIYQIAEKYDESMEYLKLCLDVSGAGMYPPQDLATALYRVGETCFHLKEFDCQVDALHVCVAIRREVLGNDHELVAEALSQLRLPFNVMNQYCVCLALSSETYRIRLLTSKGKREKEVITSLLDMATDLKHLGENERSLYCYLHAEILASGTDGNVDEAILGGIYSSISEILFDLGECDLSLVYLQKCLTLFRRSCIFNLVPASQKNEKLAEILFIKGSIEATLGNVEATMNCYSEALLLWDTIGESGRHLARMNKIFRLWRFEVVASLTAGAA